MNANEVQKTLPKHEPLAITGPQVKDKIKEINDKVKKIMSKPLPPPPPKEEPKKEEKKDEKMEPEKPAAGEPEKMQTE